MAADDINIKISTAIDTANSAKSIQEIRKSLKDLISLSGQVGDPEGFKKLADSINHTEEKLSNLNDSFNTLKGSGVERLNSSFSLLKEGFESFDGDKIGTAFKGVGAAMDAIPIFLLIEGVKALIENFDVVVDVFKSFTTSAKEEAKALSQLNANLGEVALNLQEIADLEEAYTRNTVQRTKLAIEAAKQRGASDKELNKIETEGNAKKLDILKSAEKNYREQKEFADSQLDKAREVGDEEQIKKNKELLDQAEKLYKESKTKVIEADNDAAVKQAEIQTKISQDQREAYKKRLEAEDKALKESTAEREADYLSRVAEEDKQEQDKLAKEKAQQDKLKQIAENAKDKANEDAFKADINAIAKRKALYPIELQDKIDALAKERDKVLNSTNASVDDRIVAERKYNEAVDKLRGDNVKAAVKSINDVTQAAGKVANDVLNAVNAFAELAAQKREQEAAAIQKAADAQVTTLEEQKEKELNVVGLSSEQKDAINNKYAQKEYELKLTAYNKETELKKKTFEADKKFRIVQTVISTITGAMSALTSALSSLPYPAGLIAGLISAAAVTAVGVASVLKIKNQQFDAGTPPTPPGGASGGISSGGSSSSNPNPGQNFNTNVVGQASTAATNAATNANQNGAQRVYVTETDITNTQKKVSVIQQKATIG